MGWRYLKRTRQGYPTSKEAGELIKSPEPIDSANGLSSRCRPRLDRKGGAPLVHVGSGTLLGDFIFVICPERLLHRRQVSQRGGQLRQEWHTCWVELSRDCDRPQR